MLCWIFDVDDTLVEYVDFDFLEWYRFIAEPVARELGLPMSAEKWRGILRGEVSRRFSEEYGVPAKIFWRMVDERNLEYRRRMWKEGRIRRFEDTGVLGELPGKKVAWSSSSGECIRFVLEKTSLLAHFDLILGKDYGDYSHLDGVKPSPGLIEVAKRMLGCDDCVVIGNSEVDMEAARRAGCRGIKISRNGKGSISSLWELKNIL